jgi:predicted phage tail protein
MKTIKLYGELAKKFGKEFELEVRSVAEAIRALCIMVSGFREHLEKHSEPGYVVRINKESIDADSLVNPVSNKEIIKIIPVVAGASAVGRIIIGVALVAVAFMLGGPVGGAAMFESLTAFAATMSFYMGMSLTLGGVAELLAPSPPKMEGMKPPEQTPSYMFDGPVNTMGAGYAVPVGYGELLVGSHVISAELISVEEPIGGTSTNTTRKSGIFSVVGRFAATKTD